MNGFKDNTLGLVRAIISSHALFNSLSAIQNNIASDEKRTALQNLSEFGKFLRSVSTLSSEKMTDLKTEIAFLNQYLSLEKMRFGDALSITIQSSIKNDFTLIPALLLQPLIEQNLMYCTKLGMREISIDVDITETETEVGYQIKTNRKSETPHDSLSVEQLDRVLLLEERFKLFEDSSKNIKNTTTSDVNGSLQIIKITK